MCWCNPNVRTPNCGKLDCVPPGSIPPPFNVSQYAGTGILNGNAQQNGQMSLQRPLKIYKITREGGIVITEDGGRNWKHAEGVVINEQTIAFTEQLNLLVKELRGKS